MKRIRRVFHVVSVALGYAVLVSLTAAALVLLGRWAQVTWFYAPLAPERLAEKERYLASLPAARDGAPNIVVVFFDDLGWGDLSSYGNRLIDTPRIDALAAEGVRMTAFYSASPVCTPSRAALLTGRFPIRTRTHQHVFMSDEQPAATVRKVLGLGNELVRDEILLPEVLSAAGYATGMVGKWHLGGRPGHRPNDFGFDFYYGVHWSNDMLPLHVYRNDAIEERDERQPTDWIGGFHDEDLDAGDGIDQRTLTARYTDEAISFVEQNRDRPFLLYFAHTFPHVPHFASREHAGSSEGGLYGDVVEDLDRSVGRLVDALARLGLDESTLIVVTSDNGADYNGSPGHLRGRKQQTYEGGQRVPLIARWPGRIPAGIVTGAISMNTDLFPTFLGLAGLPLPTDRSIDGRDVAPVWLDGADSPNEVLFYMATATGATDAVRDARFKYFAEAGTLGRRKPQLFLVDADAEAHNLVSRYPEQARALAERLAAWQASVEANPRGWR